MTLSAELLLTIFLALISGCSFILGATWKISQKNTLIAQRLNSIESSISEIIRDITSELEQRLEILENNFNHEDELIRSLIKQSEATTGLKVGRLIAKHEANKQRIASINEQILEIKQHLVGLQQGLNRNGIAVRIEDAWLQNAIQETLNNSDISGFR